MRPMGVVLAVLSAALLAPSLLQVCIGRDLYSVLGVRRQSTEDDIKKAYRGLAKKYHPDKNPSEEAKNKFLEIQRAYETLGDKDKRREYDRTGRDANQQQQPNQGGGFQRNHHFHNHFHEHFFHQNFQEYIPSDTTRLSSADFGRRVFNSHTPWLVQLYHDRHPDCAVFSRVWEAAAKELGGWANLGRVEVTRERAVLAQMRLQGPQLRVPSVFGFPPGCSSMQCSVRLPGSFHSWRDQTISDFVANKLLKLDSIPDVGPSGVRRFLSSVPPHKVGVLAFSARGKAASLALRKAATDAAPGAAFGRVPRPSSPRDVAFWRKEFGVTSWPAVVFFKGPGAEPLVVDSNSDRIDVAKLVKEHGRQALPALRHNTLKALGCTFGVKQQLGGKGYCAVLVGRHSELMERSRAALVEVLAILNDREAPLEYADAARLYLRRALSLAWVDAAQQPSWCRYHLGPSAPACSRWPWQSSEVSLVVFVSGGGPAHRWVTYDGDVGRDLKDKGPEEFASWLSQLLSSLGAMFKERATPPDPLVDMDKPGLVEEAAKVAASAINDLVTTAFASEEVAQVMFNAWPLLLFAALALFNMTGFFSDDSGPQAAGQARGPMRFVDPDEGEGEGNEGAAGDSEPLTDDQVSKRALSSTPSLTKVATMPPRRDSPRYLLLLVLPETIDHQDPDMSAGILNSMMLAKRFEPDRKFGFFKLWESDQPEWSDLVQRTLERSPDGKDRCCLMIWAPCRKRCQVVWPLNLDRAVNRMEDIVSGGGSWDRVPLPSLW